MLRESLSKPQPDSENLTGVAAGTLLAEAALCIFGASHDKEAGASGEFKRKRFSERILTDNSSLKKKKSLSGSKTQ